MGKQSQRLNVASGLAGLLNWFMNYVVLINSSIFKKKAMKGKIILALFMLFQFFIACESQKNDSEETKSMAKSAEFKNSEYELPVTIYPKGIKLGQTFDIFRIGKPIVANLIQGIDTEYIAQVNNDFLFSVTAISDQKSYEEAFSLNTKVSAGVSVYRGEYESDYSEQSFYSENTFSIVMKISKNWGTGILKPGYTVNSTLLKDRSDNDIAHQLGQYVVSQVHYGQNVYVSLKITNTNSETKKRELQRLGIKAGPWAELNLQKDRAFQERLSTTNFTIDAFANVNDNVKSVGVLASSMGKAVASNTSILDSMNAHINDVVKFENRSIVSFGYSEIVGVDSTRYYNYKFYKDIEDRFRLFTSYSKAIRESNFLANQISDLQLDPMFGLLTDRNSSAVSRCTERMLNLFKEVKKESDKCMDLTEKSYGNLKIDPSYYKYRDTLNFFYSMFNNFLPHDETFPNDKRVKPLLGNRPYIILQDSFRTASFFNFDNVLPKYLKADLKLSCDMRGHGPVVLTFRINGQQVDNDFKFNITGGNARQDIEVNHSFLVDITQKYNGSIIKSYSVEIFPGKEWGDGFMDIVRNSSIKFSLENRGRP